MKTQTHGTCAILDVDRLQCAVPYAKGYGDVARRFPEETGDVHPHATQQSSPVAADWIAMRGPPHGQGRRRVRQVSVDGQDDLVASSCCRIISCSGPTTASVPFPGNCRRRLGFSDGVEDTRVVRHAAPVTVTQVEP